VHLCWHCQRKAARNGRSSGIRTIPGFHGKAAIAKLLHISIQPDYLWLVDVIYDSTRARPGFAGIMDIDKSLI
jgi:hypothetical protein